MEGGSGAGAAVGGRVVGNRLYVEKEKTKNMISSVTGVLWGLVPLGIVGLLFYLVARKKGDYKTGPRHGYYYLVSFITVAILYWAVADMVRIAVTKTLVSSYSYNSDYNQEQKAKQVAGRLAAIFVAFPLWAFHWMKANSGKGQPVDTDSKKAYALATVICTMIVMLITWPFAVYYVLIWAMGVTETNLGEIIPSLLAYAIPGTGLWWVHFRMWRGLGEGEKTESPKAEI
jgi:hypothetical protein